MDKGHKFTVFLKSTASFFGGKGDASFMRHVHSANPIKAIVDAQEQIIEEKGIDRNMLDAAGGSDAIMPVMYVVSGHIESIVRGETVNGPNTFIIRRNGGIVEKDIASWDEAKSKCFERIRKESNVEPQVPESQETRPLPFGEWSMGGWEDGRGNYWSVSELRARIVAKW